MKYGNVFDTRKKEGNGKIRNLLNDFANSSIILLEMK